MVGNVCHLISGALIHTALTFYIDLILSFFDVQGNYFTVLAFRYTNLLSAQLINFWAIVVVVVLSFIFLHVRYRALAVVGILVCVAGMGVLIASDKITKTNDYTAESPLKGDLFALLGATCYGFSNTLQEFMVSKRPMYEVVGMIALWGMIINGVQAGIFDREAFQATVWTREIGGYLAGFDLILVLFYSLAPLVFRMGSAAFLNISLLTGNFWGAIIGIHVFGITVHWMYPLAFVMILVGLTVYFLWDSPLGDSAKPWLGENQELGVDGVGTARRRVEHDAVV
jgi:solute carrier family 35 protein F1/2